jgi:hypothetical protein
MQRHCEISSETSSESLRVYRRDSQAQVAREFRSKAATEDVWPFDRPFYLILNLAIGGGWGGKEGIDDTIFPQRFEIDYVRVYKHRDTQ